MHPDKQAALRRDFPALFARVSDTPIQQDGITAGDGWEPLLRRLCQQLLELPGPVPRFVQIKEKFGLLRAYLRDATEAHAQLAIEAERESATICEDCGEPGSLHRKTPGVWIRTLCRTCADQRGFAPWPPTPKESP